MHLSGRFPPNCAAFKARSAQVGMLVLNLDNGPESHSHRTQFMGRLVGLVARHGVAVRLASYPPYRSTYNPVQRCWGSWRCTGTAACSTPWRRYWATAPP